MFLICGVGLLIDSGNIEKTLTGENRITYTGHAKNGENNWEKLDICNY